MIVTHLMCVIAGLDPAIPPAKDIFQMDARVRPAHDNSENDAISSWRESAQRAPSQTMRPIEPQPFTSPHLWGEVGEHREPGEGLYQHAPCWPLTPTLSP